MSKIATLLRKDLRGIYRDRFVFTMMFYPFVLAVVTRLLVPVVPITNVGLYAAPLIPMMAASIIGTVLGFAMIEERETRTWLLLRVLPLQPSTLFLYLTVSASALTFVVNLLCLIIYGVKPADLVTATVLVAVTSLMAALMMLLLGALASNKIEGLTIGKIISALGSLPLLVFVLPQPWQLLLAWNPWYWLYVGMLKAFAGPSTASELTLAWPATPDVLYWMVPLVMMVFGTAALLRLYRSAVTTQ